MSVLDTIVTVSKFSLIKEYVNEAIKRVDDTSAAEMQKITGAFGMPGMPGLF